MARCPLCGGDRFQAMTRTLARRIKAGLVSERSGRRKHSICSGCGARPRTRLMFATLQSLDLLRPEKQVLHLAAEKPLVDRFKPIYGDNYTIANLSMAAMSAFDGVKKLPLDLCRPPPPGMWFDIVIHSHILEHVHCNWALAIMRINSMLTEDGIHIFCVPIHSRGYYKEDLDPHLTREMRVAQFGQNDHVRNFVKTSFLEEIRELCRLTGFEVRLATEMLGRSAVKHIEGSGHVFLLRRPDGQSPSPS